MPLTIHLKQQYLKFQVFLMLNLPLAGVRDGGAGHTCWRPDGTAPMGFDFAGAPAAAAIQDTRVRLILGVLAQRAKQCAGGRADPNKP